jgi:hypothetical protein
LSPGERFLERHRHLDMQIGTTLTRRLARAAFGEHFCEQVTEGGRVVNPARRKVKPFEAAPRLSAFNVGWMARVVARAASRIDERLVRLQDLLEPGCRGLITRVDIRVEPSRKTTISPLDLGLARSLLHA